MAISIKYFVTDANGNLIDWYNRTGAAELDIFGKEAAVFGSVGDDSIYVQAWTSADLTQLGTGGDKIYLSGNLSNYTQSIDQQTGVYTFTRIGGVNGQAEVVKVAVLDEDDVLYFADGHISLNVATNTALHDGTSYQQITTLDNGGTSTTPSELGQTTTSVAATKVFVADSAGVAIPMAPQTEQALKLFGGIGDDSVYVRAGTKVDATEMSTGNDKVYLTGALADYTQMVDQSTGVYTFTRTIGGATEEVKVTLLDEDDVVYFADGHIVFNVTRTDVTLHDGTSYQQVTQGMLSPTGTPGLSDVQSIAITSGTGGQNNTYNAGDEIVFTVTMKSAVDVDTTGGSPRLAIDVGGTTVYADYDSTLTGGDTNKTALKFKYTVASNQTDANGISIAAGSASTSAIDVNGGHIYKTGTTTDAKITQSPGVADQVDYAVDTTASAPSLQLLSDTGSSNSDGISSVGTVNVSGLEPGATWEYSTDAGNTWTAGTGASFTLVAGTYAASALQVRQTDAAGNVSGVGSNAGLIEVDITPPSDVTFTTNTGTALTGNSVISGAAEAGATVSVTIDPDNNAGTNNSFVYNVVANGQGAWSLNLSNAVPVTGTVSLPSGTAQVSVTQTDLAGNTGNPVSATYTVAGGTPSISVLGPTDAQGQLLKDANGNVLGVDEGAGVLRFAVLRSGDTSGTSTVDFTTQNGTATAGSDYTANSGTLTFNAGESLKIVTVALTDDSTVEPTETVRVQLSNATGANLTSATATANILDNEVSVWSVSAPTDVAENVGVVTYTVSRTGASDVATIDFATGGGTASAGSDYTALSQPLSFAAGEMSKTITVTVNDDSIAESDETLVANISNASTGNIATASVSTTLHDNEQAVWSISSNGSADEGAGYLSFVVSRTGASGAATVNVATVGGSATSGSDYTALSQPLSFAAGEMSKLVQVAITDDVAVEANETVTVGINSVTAGVIQTASATGTINDNEQSNWSVSLATSTVSESDGFISFVVSRTGASDLATIDFATAGGTATAGADYTAVNPALTLSFAAGEMSKTIQVAVNNDTTPEANETVVGVLSDASTGAISFGTATATIVDDDQISWSIEALGSASEGGGALSWRVTRTSANSAETANLSILGGSATAGVDYTVPVSLSGPISFAQGELSKVITLAVSNDTVVEGDETVVLGIVAVSAGSVSLGRATSNILDDDGVQWSVSAPSEVYEGAGSVQYTITRTGDTSSSDTIEFLMTGATATAGSDFLLPYDLNTNPDSNRLTFAAGETTKTVSVSLLTDALAESPESLRMNLTNPSRGTLNIGEAKTIIVDNGMMSWNAIAVGDVTEGSGVMSFIVSRSGDISTAATINYGLSSATAGFGPSADFGAALPSGSLNFAEGESSKVVTVPVHTDSLSEDSETVKLVIFNPDVGTINQAVASANILSSGAMYWRVTATSSFESSGKVTFTVTRTGDIDQTASVSYNISEDTAILGSDFEATDPDTLVFAAGEATKTVVVNVINDDDIEPDETLAITLSNPTLGLLYGSLAVAEISDDDDMKWRISSQSEPFSQGASGGEVGFVISRTGNLDSSASVTFRTQNAAGSVAGTDFEAISNLVVNFNAGESSHFVPVEVYANSTTFGRIIQFSGVISNASQGVILRDNITSRVVPSDSVFYGVVGSGDMAEAGAGAYFVVSRIGNIEASSTVNYTLSGSALGNYYTGSSSGTVSFAAGESTKVVYLPINDDALAAVSAADAIRSLVMSLTLPASDGGIAEAGTLYVGGNQATVNVSDDETAVFKIETAGAVRESGASLTFTVTRTGDLSATHTVDYQLVAVANRYYVGELVVMAQVGQFSGLNTAPVTLTFLPGEAVKQITIPVPDNLQSDPVWGIGMQITNPSSGFISSAAAKADAFIIDTSSDAIAIGAIDSRGALAPVANHITNFGDSTTYPGGTYLNLNAGDDYLALSGSLSSSRHAYTGYTGIDTINFQALPEGVSVTFVDGAPAVRQSGNISTRATLVRTGKGDITAADFENYIFTDFADTLNATAVTNQAIDITTRGGNDTVILSTGGAVDTLRYYSINTTLADGGLGHDTVTNFNMLSDVLRIGMFGTAVTAANLSQYLQMNGSTLQVDVDGTSSSTFGWTDLITFSGGTAPANATDLDTMFAGGKLVTDYNVSAFRVTAATAKTENQGTQAFTVTREGRIDVEASVTLSLMGAIDAMAHPSFSNMQGASGFAAIPDSDFNSFSPTTLTFAAGETEKLVTYNLIDDSIRNAPVGVAGQLSNPSNGAILINNAALNRINDDDGGSVSQTGASVSYNSATDGSVFWSFNTTANTLNITDDSNPHTDVLATFAGGAGAGIVDTVNYSALSAGVVMTGITSIASTVTTNSTVAYVTGNTIGTHQLSHFESYTLTNFADTVDLSGAKSFTTLAGLIYTRPFVVNAGGGDDTIKGSLADDKLTGGTGTDTFVFSMINSSSATAGNGNDTIADFTTNKDAVLDANEDKIDLSAIFSGQGITVDSGNLSTYLNVVSGTNSQLQIDRDGAGTAYTFTTIATLTGVNMANADLNNLLTSGQLVL